MTHDREHSLSSYIGVQYFTCKKGLRKKPAAPGPTFDQTTLAAAPGPTLDQTTLAAAPGPTFDQTTLAAAPGPTFDQTTLAAAPGPTFDQTTLAAAPGPTLDQTTLAAAPGPTLDQTTLAAAPGPTLDQTTLAAAPGPSYLPSDHSGGGDCKVHFYIRSQSHGILKKWSWKVMEKSWNFICRSPWEPCVRPMSIRVL